MIFSSFSKGFKSVSFKLGIIVFGVFDRLLLDHTFKLNGISRQRQQRCSPSNSR